MEVLTKISKQICQQRRASGRDLNLGLPGYEASVQNFLQVCGVLSQEEK
jgi:hypothetical protein